jgi:hypothetical protein
VFEPGDLVWLHLRKDRFPDLRKSKLMPRADGPFKVIKQVNDNAYKLDLPAKFGVSSTFNVADLKPYLGEDDEIPSRTTSIQEGGDDEDISSTVTPSATPANIPQGPMTRARTRQLNCQVLSFLNTYDLNAKNMVLPSSVDLLVIRNEGMGEWSREDKRENQVGKEDGHTINVPKAEHVKLPHGQIQGGGPQAHANHAMHA